jgi:uncharacterized protein YndB with AHSA1/START domain
MDGRLENVNDRWQLKFRRELRHPPAKVWKALTEPEQLDAWFPTTVIGDRTAGAPLRFTFRGEDLPPFDGEMLAYEPCSLLEFRWGPDVLRFELEPVGLHTVLTLTDTFEELGKAARDGAGWHVCLDGLAEHLDGVAPPPDADQRWQRVHPGYVEQFGPEAATIGPPARA